MELFKLERRKVNLGKWAKKAEITISKYDLDFKIYNFPFIMGASINSDLPLEESDFDIFSLEIIEDNGAFKIFNLSEQKTINFENRLLRFLDSNSLAKSTKINFKDTQLIFMPDIKIKKKAKKGQDKIKCPYCGEIFNVNDGCQLCGFGLTNSKESKSHKSVFSRFLNKSEENIEKKTEVIKLGGLKEFRVAFVIDNGPYQGKEITIPESSSEITIGRSVYNAVSLSFLEDQTMSRFHCKIKVEGGKVIISDNNSLNGTYVNNRMINDSFKLSSGDIIQLGNTKLRIKMYKEG